MNKTTEALKLAEEALEDISDHTWIGRTVALKALAAIREALAKSVKQEPVAWKKLTESDKLALCARWDMGIEEVDAVVDAFKGKQ